MNGGRWYAFLNGATRCLETQPLSDYTAALNSNYYCRRDPFVYVCVCVYVCCVRMSVLRLKDRRKVRVTGKEREREREKFML